MKAKYLLPCSCGQEIPVELSRAGQHVRCACGADLEVPTLRELSGLKRVEPSRPARGARTTPTWTPRQGRLLLGAALTMFGLVLLGYVQYKRPRLADMRTMSPLDTWALWQELRRGADRLPSPGAEAYAESLLAARRWTAVTLGIVALGVLVMLSSSLVRRRRPVRVGRPPGRSPPEAPAPTAEPR